MLVIDGKHIINDELLSLINELLERKRKTSELHPTCRFYKTRDEALPNSILVKRGDNEVEIDALVEHLQAMHNRWDRINCMLKECAMLMARQNEGSLMEESDIIKVTGCVTD